MIATLTCWIRRRAVGIALVAAWLVAVLAGCSVDAATGAGTTGDPSAPGSVVSPSSMPGAAAGVPVVLRFGDHRFATATLADTRAAREFAAMLPLTVQLTDRMGQAKFGRLPHPLDLTGADRRFDTTVGEIIYWSPRDTLATVYAGHPTLSEPGVVCLGVVATGLDDFADAGSRIMVRIAIDQAA